MIGNIESAQIEALSAAYLDVLNAQDEAMKTGGDAALEEARDRLMAMLDDLTVNLRKK